MRLGIKFVYTVFGLGQKVKWEKEVRKKKRKGERCEKKSGLEALKERVKKERREENDVIF